MLLTAAAGALLGSRPSLRPPWTGPASRRPAGRLSVRRCSRQASHGTPAPGDPDGQHGSEPARPAAGESGKMRALMRASEKHRECGWIQNLRPRCCLAGLAPLMLFTTVLLAVRNQRVLAAWNARQEENARRVGKGLPPRTRRRRRKALTPATAPPRQPPARAPPPRSPAGCPATTRPSGHL